MAAVRFLLLFSSSLFLLLLLPTSSAQPVADSLLKFKQSLKDDNGALNSWDPKTPPCRNWYGVYCQNGRVTGIHFTNVTVGGAIDAEALNALPDLRTINLYNNTFTGQIPPFNKITDLKSLYVSVNQFTGEIPNDYFVTMVKLKRLSLSNNKFTGKIPDSVMKLTELEQLNLANNQFDGGIPPLKDGAILNSIDLNNNKLSGEIPGSFSKFDPKSFAGNNGLCGKPLDKACGGGAAAGGGGAAAGGGGAAGGDGNESPSQDSTSEPSAFANLLIPIVLAAIIILFLLIAIVSGRKQRTNDFSALPDDNSGDNHEIVDVRITESVKKPPGVTRKGGESSRRGSQHGGKNNVADLTMVNSEVTPFGMPDLMKAAAEVLGNGSLGSAYKAVMANGLSVVVKRIREMNKIGREEFDTEMRRFGRLSHPNILAPLAYHFRREEKLIISEYMPKSNLLYVLHGDRGIVHSELNWPTRLKIVQGVGRGMNFLHKEFPTYDLPHGNLKSSNILLTDTYDPVLSDYAFLPLIPPNVASQGLFAFKSPEYVQNQQISRKADVYCLGITILETVTGKFPAQYLSNGKGGIDIIEWVQTSFAERKEDELIDPEILAGNTNSVGEMVKLLQIGAACIASNPDERPEMSEAHRRIEEVQNLDV